MTLSIAHSGRAFLLSDLGFGPVQPGAGCQRIQAFEVSCEAESLGPVELGDRADRFSSASNSFHGVFGGAGDDALDVPDDEAYGGGGDVLIARVVTAAPATCCSSGEAGAARATTYSDACRRVLAISTAVGAPTT